MNTSQTSFLSEILDDASVIPEGKYSYFRERTRNRLYSLLIGEFLKKEKAGEMSRSHLAKRLNKTKAQVSRLLSGPGNWEIATISDLALAIGSGLICFSIEPLGHANEITSKVLSKTANKRAFKTLNNSENFEFTRSARVVNVVASNTNASTPTIQFIKEAV